MLAVSCVVPFPFPTSVFFAAAGASDYPEGRFVAVGLMYRRGYFRQRIDGGAAANGASAGDRSSAAGGIEVVLLRDMRMTGLYFL